ncbi:hypothetical protein Sste5344_001888 [Sporothrix stenoceras]
MEVRGEVVKGDCVLAYGQEYSITVGPYIFQVIWTYRNDWDAFIDGEFKKVLKRGELVRSRDRPTVDDSTQHTWHNTRIHTASRVLFREAQGVKRERLGNGSSGTVYKATDFESGRPFAIKVVAITIPNKGNVDEYARVDYERSIVHKEIKTMEQLSHPNIIELLGSAKLDTHEPEIFMPMRPGSVQDLKAADKRICGDQFCFQLLEQILSALDYMASMTLCHRDIKPANILYYKTGTGYVFQLTDFGSGSDSTANSKPSTCPVPSATPRTLWGGHREQYSSERRDFKADSTSWSRPGDQTDAYSGEPG